MRNVWIVRCAWFVAVCAVPLLSFASTPEPQQAKVEEEEAAEPVMFEEVEPTPPGVSAFATRTGWDRAPGSHTRWHELSAYRGWAPGLSTEIALAWRHESTPFGHEQGLDEAEALLKYALVSGRHALVLDVLAATPLRAEERGHHELGAGLSGLLAIDALALQAVAHWTGTTDGVERALEYGVSCGLHVSERITLAAESTGGWDARAERWSAMAGPAVRWEPIEHWSLGLAAGFRITQDGADRGLTAVLDVTP
jgi:hypothetical protein